MVCKITGTAMKKIDYSDYSFLNLLRICWQFISKYPKSLLEIYGYKVLLHLVSIFVTLFGACISFIILLIWISILGFFSKIFHLTFLDLKPVAIFLAIPFGLLFAFAPWISKGVVEANIYQKYALKNNEIPSIIGSYLENIFIITKEVLSWDAFIVLLSPLIFLFINYNIFLFVAIIAGLYLFVSSLYKITKLVYLPYATYYKKFDNEKSLLEYVYQIPLRTVFLMFFYSLIILNIFNTFTGHFDFENKYLIIASYVEGLKLEHIIALLLVPLSETLVSILDIIYFDIRARDSFAKTTKIGKSILISLAIIFLLIIMVMVMPGMTGKSKNYQDNYFKKYAATIMYQAMNTQKGIVYRALNPLYKKNGKDASYDELPQDLRDALERDMKIDLNESK